MTPTTMAIGIISKSRVGSAREYPIFMILGYTIAIDVLETIGVPALSKAPTILNKAMDVMIVDIIPTIPPFTMFIMLFIEIHRFYFSLFLSHLCPHELRLNPHYN